MTDQELVPDLHYPWEHAGRETSLLMAIRPDLVDLSKTLKTDNSLRDYYISQSAHLHRRQYTNYNYIGVLTGTDDDSNDPELTASVERGQFLLEIISKQVADRALGLLGEVGTK